MLGCSTVTVLVPEQLAATPDSLLCGSFTSSEDTADGGISYAVVITGASVHRKPLCLGRINNGNRMQTRRTTTTAANNEENAVWVELQTQPHITLQSVTIQEGRLREKPVPLREVNLVVYDAAEICRSELIARKFPCGSERDHANDIVPYLIHCVQRDCKDTYSPKNRSISNLFILSLLRLILLTSWIPKVVLQTVESLLVNKLDYSSTALRQILFRIAQLEKIQEEIKSNNKETLLSGRLLLMILLDVLAGIAIACVISSHVSVTDVYTNFRSWTKVVAGSVDLLLEWLRGAPAGLKLNQPLTQALASFFSYHVHLWRLYLATE